MRSLNGRQEKGNHALFVSSTQRVGSEIIFERPKPRFCNRLWDANFRLGEDLARRMALKADLARSTFEYPAGMMFWCRPRALRPLTELDLQWTDYPPEPLPGDGTIAHAIERLLPFICESEGYGYASVVPVPAG